MLYFLSIYRIFLMEKGLEGFSVGLLSQQHVISKAVLQRRS